nr:hypothetical protein [Tanacetum cinerariifolium]
MEDGSGPSLHLNVDKTKVFWPKEDPQSILTGYTLLCAHVLLVSSSLLNVLLTWLFVLLWSVLSLLLDQDLVTSNGELPPYLLHLGGLTKLLRHTGIISPESNFDDALSVFNTSMESDLLSNPRIPLFSGLKPCSACSKVFAGDIYGGHAVSCAGIIGIKHLHNAMRDTLVDICYHFEISVGKEVDIGLDRGVTNHYIQQIFYFTHGMEDLMCVWV